MKTLSKWYPVILTILETVAVLTTFVVKCAGQQPIANKCNTQITYILYLNGSNKPDTIVAYAYIPVDSLTNQLAVKK